MLAVPIAFMIAVAMRGSEQRDRRAVLIDNESTQPPGQVRGKRCAEHSIELDVRSVRKLHA
jgi:hypothetical protein